MSDDLQPSFAGIYDPPTAARYLLAGRGASEAYPVDSRTLIRWAKTGLASPSLQDTNGWDMVLSFEDLISLRVTAALRSADVSWPTIRRAERWMREATGYPRPFAREEIWTSGTDIFSKLRGQLIAASRHGQLAMDTLSACLIPVSGLVFEDRIARAWAPQPFITLDPVVQFGEPCITGTRIPAGSIASMVRGGDTRALVMRAYGLDEIELDAALSWTARVAA